MEPLARRRGHHVGNFMLLISRSAPPFFPANIYVSGVQGRSPGEKIGFSHLDAAAKDASASCSQGGQACYPVATLSPDCPPALSLSISLSPHLDVNRGYRRPESNRPEPEDPATPLVASADPSGQIP